jgi:hypothetical protein
MISPFPFPRPRPTQTMTAGPTNPFASPNAVADWWANGGSQFAGNALQDLGVGLQTGPTIWTGLGAATKRSAEMQPYRDEQMRSTKERNATIEAFKRAGRTDLVEYVEGGGDVGAAYNHFMQDSASEQERALDRATRERSAPMFKNPQVAQAYLDGEISFNEAWKLEAGGGQDGASYYGTPIPYTRDDGSIGYMQLNDQGGAQEVQFPEGARPAVPVEYLNTKTGFEGRDRFGNPAGGSLDINNEQAAFETELGGGQAKTLLEGRVAAQDAVQAIRAGEDALKLLDNGMITGAFADWKVGFGKALQAAGINFSKDEIANTEAFVATRAQEVGRLIKMFGAGTGLSDADRQYAERAAAGQITLTEDSIRKIIALNAKAARNILNSYNTQAGAAEQGKIPSLTVGAQGPVPTASDPLGLGF